MRWSNFLSTRPSLEAAVKEVAEKSLELLGATADLGLVFISSAFTSEYPRLMPLLKEYLPETIMIGCGGGGIVGMDENDKPEEVEQQIAISLSLAHLPEVAIKAFHISAGHLPDLDSSPDLWCNLIGVPTADQPQFIILADPFFTKINDLLQGLDYAYPNSPKVGGLASSGLNGQGTGLFCEGRFYQEGTVGVSLSGKIILETIVAQGCRPIGKPYRVTEVERNIVLELEELVSVDQVVSDGIKQSPLEALQNLVQNLNEKDRKLAENSLFIGIVRDEFKQNLEQGDFLIRNLIGVDPKAGAIAIGDRVRTGQRIQFHLRDANTSAEDLEMLLQRYQREVGLETISTNNAAGLMFSCMGRGEGLYGKPNFDSRLFSSYLNVPISGFFCNGEIGPVGGSTFLHGYTSVFGICREPS
ncbi:FIST N-terminal domain-containing protein [Okeania sp.]|uniref:FIST signal transduction protein n=1 Tax=Okeania sp. TaxID=3100323 RepID=UPI002B4B7D7D|nr:FIST N-terminal domain-containing protein [Okeania sp.]MEB3341939.1 FIST N-terminal domain-containing protein [Okeania sp.]